MEKVNKSLKYGIFVGKENLFNEENEYVKNKFLYELSPSGRAYYYYTVRQAQLNGDCNLVKLIDDAVQIEKDIVKKYRTELNENKEKIKDFLEEESLKNHTVYGSGLTYFRKHYSKDIETQSKNYHEYVKIDRLHRDMYFLEFESLVRKIRKENVSEKFKDRELTVSENKYFQYLTRNVSDENDKAFWKMKVIKLSDGFHKHYGYNQIEKTLMDKATKNPDVIDKTVGHCFTKCYGCYNSFSPEDELRKSIGIAFIKEKIENMIKNKKLRIDTKGRIVPMVRDIIMENKLEKVLGNEVKR